jgi:hypothetical protein
MSSVARGKRSAIGSQEKWTIHGRPTTRSEDHYLQEITIELGVSDPGHRGLLSAHFRRGYRVLCCSRKRLTTPDLQHGLGCVRQRLIIDSRVGGRQSLQAVDHLPEFIIWFPTCNLKRLYQGRIVRIRIPMTQHICTYFLYEFTYVSIST